MALTMVEHFLKLIGLFLILECIFGADVKDDLDRVNLKRLSTDPLRNYPEEIRTFLPASSETNTSSRFSLLGLRHADLDKISQLSKNHTICLGCHISTPYLFYHECRNDIIICNAGSVCMNASIVADVRHIHDPQAITAQAASYPYKGCCNPSDVHCRSTTRSVHTCSTTANCTTRGNYEIAVCRGSLCNVHDVSEIAVLKSAMPPVNGGWSTWGSWSHCTCRTGTGTHLRHRVCNNPVPSMGGADCSGSSSERVSCTDECHVNGGWSSWGAWSQCACDTGTWTRHRECNNPAPALGGSDCVGTRIEQSPCTDRCPVNGNWGTWGTWSHCNCNTKTNNRTRECSNPAPARGGADCVGVRFEQSSCVDQCPVNGNWGAWGTWSHCACNTGTRNRTRACNNPVPARGGADCIGIPHENSSCAEQCPGQWMAWNTLVVCSSTCGEGMRVRLRQCLLSDNITKTHNCPGESIVSESCINLPCPTTTPVPSTVVTTAPSTTTTEGPGVWTEWTQWSACSRSCGSGFRYIARFCIDPRTEHEKHDCPGLAVDGESCEVKICPVDGSWSEWNGWGRCHRGLQSRSRECNNPAPLYNGTNCQGSNEDVTNCTEETTITTLSPLVQLVPPEIFGPTETDVGGNITLLCLTGVPDLNVTWFYQESDSLPLGVSQPYGTNELIITGVDSKNYGKYTCALSDGSKTVKNQVVINLHESAPVILYLIKSPDTVAEGSPVKLKCDVLAFPDPIIRWGYKDRSGNAYVPPPVSYKDGGKEIDIDSFQSVLYGGTWTCNAINKLGSDHRDIVV